MEVGTIKPHRCSPTLRKSCELELCLQSSDSWSVEAFWNVYVQEASSFSGSVANLTKGWGDRGGNVVALCFCIGQSFL